MRSVVLALMLVSSMNVLADLATAQSQTFPYDAVILDDEVYSRSGPGRQYYPTSRFRKGDRVTVVRHDPGGWFMIDPPLGSFNWVRKEFVRREGDHGVVMADAPVVAWMGTTFGDDHYVEKRRLQKGERVEILAERVLKDERGEVPYYKIQPPPGDFRWIPGAKVIPADKSSGMSQNRNRDKMRDPNVSPVDLSEFGDEDNSIPKSVPGEKRVPPPRDLAGETRSAPSDIERDAKPSPFARSREADTKLPFETGDFPSSTSTPANGSANKSSSPAWDRIRAVDDELQAMLKKDSREWHFTAIETELRELVDHDETSGAARNRLAMLGRYQRIKADQDELARIMEETSRRDSDLAKSAAQPVQSFTPPTVVPEPSATARPAAPRSAAPLPNATNRPLVQPNHNSGQATRTQPLPGTQPTPQGLRAAPSGPLPNNSLPNNTTPASGSPLKPRFDGAGIIQRTTSSAAGVPKHVLMHPSGRVLAYLNSEPGVNLDNFVGEPMGLEGRRIFRPELNADLLTVRNLKPVKLKP